MDRHGRCVGNHPDVLHSYYAICGLSLAGWPGLQRLDARLGISERASIASGHMRAEDRHMPPCEPCDPEPEQGQQVQGQGQQGKRPASASPPSFVASGFSEKVAYEAWLASLTLA